MSEDARAAVACCVEIVREVEASFLSPDYAGTDPADSFSERFACRQAAKAIEDEFRLSTSELSALRAIHSTSTPGTGDNSDER